MKFELRDTQLVYLVEDEVLAYIDFEKENNNYELNKVFVDPSLRGQGVAQKLMDEMVAILKKDGTTCTPVCSYAVAYFDKRPELSTLKR